MGMVHGECGGWADWLNQPMVDGLLLVVVGYLSWAMGKKMCFFGQNYFFGFCPIMGGPP